MKKNNQRQTGSKEIEEKYKLISRYALAQYEFEKIIGFEKAISLTVQEKRKIIGYKRLSNATNSALVKLLARLRRLYAHVVQENKQFPKEDK